MAAPRSPAPLRCLCARWGGETRQHRGAGDDGCGSPIWEVISAAPLNYCSLRPARICLYCLAQREERTGLVKAPETPRNCSKYCSYKFSSLLQRLRAARGVDSNPLSTLCARPPAQVPPLQPLTQTPSAPGVPPSPLLLPFPPPSVPQPLVQQIWDYLGKFRLRHPVLDPLHVPCSHQETKTHFLSSLCFSFCEQTPHFLLSASFQEQRPHCGWVSVFSRKHLENFSPFPSHILPSTRQHPSDAGRDQPKNPTSPLPCSSCSAPRQELTLPRSSAAPLGQLLSGETSEAASDFQKHSRTGPPGPYPHTPIPYKSFPSPPREEQGCN